MLLAAMLALVSVAGFLSVVLPLESTLYSLLSPALAVLASPLLYGWCRTHARTMGVAEPWGSAFICGVFAPVGVPLYLFRAFGLRRGSVSLVRAALVFFMLIAGSILGRLTAYYLLLWIARQPG
jgi:hypothetical protein